MDECCGRVPRDRSLWTPFLLSMCYATIGVEAKNLCIFLTVQAMQEKDTAVRISDYREDSA